jgi:amino acid adenylation domain-containing protein
LVHQLLEVSAKEAGDRAAVIDGDRSVTYSDLDARANQVAHLLRDAGVGKHHRVGLYLEKSLDAVAAIYGILKSGAAYVPLDPHAPPARLSLIARDCDLACLVVGRSKRDSWRDVIAEVQHPVTVLAIDSASGDIPAGVAPSHVLCAEAVDGAPSSPVDVPLNSSDVAYVLYTSGSTGQPKGVVLTHENALGFVNWARQTFEVGADDRLSSHAPFHFDLSVFDLYVAAAAAATLVLVPPSASIFPAQLRRFIESSAVNVWYSVPSILSMLVVRGGLTSGDLPSLRAVLFAGEVFPTKYLRQLMELLPHASFANLYGPTETNVCTWYMVPALEAEQEENIPIGRAIEGVDVFAVGENGRPTPQGEVGELYVTGPTVAQGYWNDVRRTSLSFVPDPRPGAPGTCYRTGDLVQQLPDGNFRLLGRRDAQVKSRGYRIELGDVETALSAHPAVVEGAVVAVPDDLVTNRLHCFVTATGDLDRDDLLQFCRDRLPQYMVPETVSVVAELPRTSTGKVDRQSLLASAMSEYDPLR